MRVILVLPAALAPIFIPLRLASALCAAHIPSYATAMHRKFLRSSAGIGAAFIIEKQSSLLRNSPINPAVTYGSVVSINIMTQVMIMALDPRLVPHAALG